MPFVPVPRVACAVCDVHAKIPFTANPRRAYIHAVLRDDGWRIDMLPDGRYVYKCPDCCDAEERDA